MYFLKALFILEKNITAYHAKSHLGTFTAVNANILEQRNMKSMEELFPGSVSCVITICLHYNVPEGEVPEDYHQPVPCANGGIAKTQTTAR